MKKQLLTILSAVSVSALFAQVPSVDWPTNQDAVFPTTVVNSGVKFMDAVDANVVWVTGMDLAAPNRAYNWYSRSTNGGATFAGGNIYSDTNTYVVANMEALDANTAWVSAYKKVGPGGTNGGGAIHRTTNGGTNWVNMTAAGMYTSTTSFANWVTFLTPMVGIANGDPVNNEYELWRTTNGGLSWTQIPGANIPNPTSGEFAIVNLYAKLGTSNLWFGTNGNRMFRSTDAGLTYSVAAIGPATNTITEIAFSSPLNGICYMFNSGATLELWNTSDGGATWTQITPLPANLGFADIGNIPGTGNLVSYGSGNANELISYSSDNGLTWTDWGSTGIPYLTGDFVDGSTAWAGSLDFAGSSSNFTDIWKYTGPAVTGTAVPAAAFAVPATLCLSGPTTSVIPVNTSAGSPALTYSWTVLPSGTLSSPTATAPTITFASAGSYTVILVATNAVGSNTTSWVVDVAACTAPVATFTLPATACTGFSFTPGNTSSGAPAPAYFWSILPAANSTVSSATASNPAFQISTAGVYSVSLLVSNASGTAQTTQTVSLTPCLPLATFTIPSFVCLEGAVATRTFVTNNGSANPPNANGTLSYTWSIAPSSGVSVLPNYTSVNLTKVSLTSTTIASYTVTLKVRNASGLSTTTQTIGAGICTGLSEGSVLANNLMVFPNPAHEQLNVLLPGSVDTYKVKLTNILGSVVYEEKALKNSGELTVINLTNKPKGVYFLTVESNNEKVTKKIVIE